MAETNVQNNDEMLVRAIDKDPGNQIQVRISRFRERDYFDIRNFYETDEGEWKPTRKGVSVPIEFFDEILEAMNAAKPEIEKRLKAAEEAEAAAKNDA